MNILYFTKSKVNGFYVRLLFINVKQFILPITIIIEIQYLYFIKTLYLRIKQIRFFTVNLNMLNLIEASCIFCKCSAWQDNVLFSKFIHRRQQPEFQLRHSKIIKCLHAKFCKMNPKLKSINYLYHLPTSNALKLGYILQNNLRKLLYH